MVGGSSNLLRIIYIEINSNISLGMDSNCILVALFRFFFFCNLYALSLCSRGIPNPNNWYQSQIVILRTD